MHSLKLKKEKYKEKKRKERKKKERKKERKKRKKERHLCLILLTWLNKADSLKAKKERKKRKKRKRRETFVFKTVCWFNIASTLKGKKEKRKELFLKSHKHLFGRRLLKLCYILNAPFVLKFIGYVVYLSCCLLLHIIFFSLASL